MKVKQKIITLALAFGVLFGGMAVLATPVYAAKCGDVDTAIIGGDICNNVNNDSGKAEDTAIWKILILVLQILTAGVGILAVGGIVYASILYTSAKDNAAQVNEARGMITNIVIGLICYGLMYVGLNFLIPGGIFY